MKRYNYRLTLIHAEFIINAYYKGAYIIVGVIIHHTNCTYAKLPYQIVETLQFGKWCKTICITNVSRLINFILFAVENLGIFINKV
jgi:hypothetical protein